MSQQFSSGSSAVKLRGNLAEGIFQRILDFTSILFTLSICLILLIGWRLRSSELINPGRGLGLLCGIIGTTMMVTLMLYPLRKRVRVLQGVGNIKMWFRIHMILGILGPVFILFHANFHLGAFNSNVALFSMLIVSTSGIAGRYIYSKIHQGLYGQRLNLVELRKSFEQQTEDVNPQFALVPGIKENLAPFAQDVLVHSTNVFQSIGRLMTIGWRARFLYWKVSLHTKSYLAEYSRQHQWGSGRRRKMQMQIQRKTQRFLNQAVKVAEFNFFERLFSLWHMLHLPLVFVLAIAVVVHIIAVNRY